MHTQCFYHNHDRDVPESGIQKVMIIMMLNQLTKHHISYLSKGGNVVDKIWPFDDFWEFEAD